MREYAGSAKRLPHGSARRLIILPVLIWFVLSLFLHDQTILGVIVYPTHPTMVSMLLPMSTVRTSAPRQGVLLTTLLSMVTILAPLGWH